MKTKRILGKRIFALLIATAMVTASFSSVLATDGDTGADVYSESSYESDNTPGTDGDNTPSTPDETSEGGGDTSGNGTPTGPDTSEGTPDEGTAEEGDETSDPDETGSEGDNSEGNPKDDGQEGPGENKNEYAGIFMADATVALGDESFDLLDGVIARDANGDSIETILVTDDGGFNLFEEGDYIVAYTATDPVDETVYEASRTVTVESPTVMPLGLNLLDSFYAVVTDYNTLKTAVEGAPTDNTPVVIALDNDIYLSGEIRIMNDTNITLVPVDSTSPVSLYQTVAKRHFSVLNQGGSSTTAGMLTLYNVVLDGNGSTAGGIINNGTVYLLEGSVIQNCSTEGLSAGQSSGGGFDNRGTLTIDGGIIRNNTAQLGGGGLYTSTASTSHIIFLDGEIYGNTAEGGYGGGIFINGGGLTMEGGKIYNNAVSGSNTKGSGVYIAKDSNQGAHTFSMSGGEIYSNGAATCGSGVYVDTGAIFNLSGDAVIRDHSSQNGGGVYAAYNSTIHMTGGEITQNTVEGSTTNYGGGMYLSGATLNMSGGKIHLNKAPQASSRGGGVYLESSNGYTATLNLSGGSIEGNEVLVSSGQGGGVYMSSGAIALSGDGKITQNQAADGGGGAFLFTGSFEMDGGSIEQNSAVTGGGVYVSANATFTLKDGMVDNNQATQNGGGIFVFGSRADGQTPAQYANFLMEGGTVSGNRANSGGGIHSDSSNTVITGGLITGNTIVPLLLQDPGGAGLHLNNAPTISGVTISHNTTTGHGGGIFIDSDTDVTLSNITVTDNSAGKFGGGIYAHESSTVSISSSTLSSNSAGWSGGGLYVNIDSDVSVSGGSITGNTAVNHGGGIYTNRYEELTVDGVSFGQNQASKHFPFQMSNTTVANTYRTYVKDVRGLTAPYDINTANETMNKAYNNLDINYEITASDLTVTYDGNGADSGTPPTDTNLYAYDDPVTLQGRETLTKTGHTFLGWSMAPGDSTNLYTPGNTFPIADHTTLYAQWQDNGGVTPIPDYTITVRHYQYDSNISTATLADTETFKVESGISFTARINEYPGYVFRAAQSDVLTIPSVSGNAEINLYYQNNGGYEIRFDKSDTIEVLDRRDPTATPLSWETFVEETGVQLYLNGALVPGATFTSADYLDSVAKANDIVPGVIDFRHITTHRVNPVDAPYYFTITASDGAGKTFDGTAALRVMDRTAPEINVLHTPITLSAGVVPRNEGQILEWTGASVTDNYDESVSIKTSFVGYTFAEIDWTIRDMEYIMYLNATDDNDNRASQRAVVIRTARSGGGDNGGGDEWEGDNGGGTTITDDDVPRGQYTQDDDGGWVLIDDGDVPLTLPETGGSKAASTSGTGFALILLAAGVSTAVALKLRKRRAG